MQRCPTCHSEQPDEARFCSNCGASLHQPQPRRTERKTVTVLFADLVNFTSRSEALDVEDVRAVLQVYHDQVRTTLERFGGTVEKFVGDAVMAVFGAPVSHEDDAERAVRAALAVDAVMAELNEAEDFDLHVRIGVHSGEALVSLDARPELGEAMVAGDVVNTASRLQTAAPVDGIVVGELTHALTERAIQYGDPQQVTLKGKAVPVTVWPVLDARANVGRDVVPPGGSVLVGRAREMHVLTDALTSVEQEQRPQLVTIIGQPGMGKTRLVTELYQIASDSQELITWRQGGSRPYGQGMAFGALSEIVRAECGLLDNDDAEAGARKLQAAVAALVDDAGERTRLEADLRPLIGLPETSRNPGDPRASWLRFLEAMAEQRPTVVVFEDLHWADDALLDFIDEVFDAITDVPLLVVATARPELLARRPHWGGGKTNAFTMSLAPLSDRDAAELIEHLLDHALSGDHDADLLSRVGGNPLYAEEFARLVRGADANLAALNEMLPASIQGIIAARIDALPGAAKEVLLDAAVSGKVFWRGGLSQIGQVADDELDEALRTLERREFVRREHRSSVAGDVQYSFRHILVRDIGYGLVPRADRVRKHWNAATWLEGLSTERASEQAEAIADHLLAALQLAGASRQGWEDLVPRTREALIRAGDRAFRLQSYVAAEERYAEALRLFDADDPAQAETLHGWIRTRRRIGRVTAEDLENVRDQALRVGSPEVAAQVEAYLGFYYYERGQPDRGRELDFAAASRVRDRPASKGKAAVLANLAGTLVSGGEDAEAIEAAEEALEMFRQCGDLDDVLINDLYRVIGMAKMHTGDPDALTWFERAVEMAVEQGSSKQAEAFHTLMEARMCLGELAEARELAASAGAFAERYSLSAPLAMVQRADVHSLYWQGDDAEALSAADELISNPATATHFMAPLTLGVRSRIRLASADIDGAVADALAALTQAEDAEREIRWPTMGLAARVFAAAGETSDARSWLKQLVELLREQGAPMLSGEEWWAADLAFAAHQLAEEVAVLEVLPGAQLGRLPRRWLEAARALLSGDVAAAIEAYDEIGSVPDAAAARLLATPTGSA